MTGIWYQLMKGIYLEILTELGMDFENVLLKLRKYGKT